MPGCASAHAHAHAHATYCGAKHAVSVRGPAAVATGKTRAVAYVAWTVFAVLQAADAAEGHNLMVAAVYVDAAAAAAADAAVDDAEMRADVLASFVCPCLHNEHGSVPELACESETDSAASTFEVLPNTCASGSPCKTAHTNHSG